ncbi:MAG: septum formation initiator family protein [Pseudomonadales bacterium]|nr:septum formation initiator family protein [Pseudomonadales bacterium]
MIRIALLFLLTLIVAFQYRLWVGEGSFAEASILEKRAVKQQTAIEILEYRNRILRAEIAELKNGLQSIEEKARSELGMIKEGETFFLLVNRKDSGKSG